MLEQECLKDCLLKTLANHPPQAPVFHYLVPEADDAIWKFVEWGLGGGIGSLMVGFGGYDLCCLAPEFSAF